MHGLACPIQGDRAKRSIAAAEHLGVGYQSTMVHVPVLRHQPTIWTLVYLTFLCHVPRMYILSLYAIRIHCCSGLVAPTRAPLSPSTRFTPSHSSNASSLTSTRRYPNQAANTLTALGG